MAIWRDLAAGALRIIGVTNVAAGLRRNVRDLRGPLVFLGEALRGRGCRRKSRSVGLRRTA